MENVKITNDELAKVDEIASVIACLYQDLRRLEALAGKEKMLEIIKTLPLPW